MIARVTDLGEVRAQAARESIDRAKRLFGEACDVLIGAIDAALAVQPAMAPTADSEAAIDAHAVADILGCHVSTVRELARQRKIPAHPIAGTGSRRVWMFFRSEIDGHIRRGEQHG